MTNDKLIESRGSQRLTLEQLRAWEALGFGMFIHFGMSTFDGLELSLGDQPSVLLCADKLDVDQWISIARDTGMKYAVLTTKHVSGHCLWPSRFTGYNVGTSGNTTDVVEAFVRACEDKGLMPGFYYCSWDNHHRLGSLTPTDTRWDWAFTTEAYREFQWRQIEELLTQYGRIGEVWVDIPKVLPRDYRHRLYNRIAELQPEAIIMMNNGFGDGSTLSVSDTWPSDIVAIERYLPNSHTGHQPWKEIEGQTLLHSRRGVRPHRSRMVLRGGRRAAQRRGTAGDVPGDAWPRREPAARRGAGQTRPDSAALCRRTGAPARQPGSVGNVRCSRRYPTEFTSPDANSAG